MRLSVDISSLVRQKESLSKRWLQENKARQISPNDEHAYINKRTLVCILGSKKWSSFGELGVLCFLVTTVCNRTFCLISDDLFLS